MSFEVSMSSKRFFDVTSSSVFRMKSYWLKVPDVLCEVESREENRRKEKKERRREEKAQSSSPARIKCGLKRRGEERRTHQD